MRRGLVKTLVPTVVLTAAASLGVVGVAQADIGDGSLACNLYEICFTRDTTNTTYQKHFWEAGVHDAYTFTNVNTGETNKGALEDNAAQVRNRDGSCDVTVIDWNGAFPSVTHLIPNNGVWTMLKDGVRDQNNEHTRC